jgi:DNA-directed RNA polymerase subunit RPC12/RpoP
LTCQSCGERFEKFLTRLIKEEDKVCPVCGSREVRMGIGGGVLNVGTSTGVSSAAGCGSGGFT